MLGAAALAACTLTTSLSGLAGPPEDADASPPDAATDADAGSPDADAGGDGAPLLPYCQTLIPAPAFCDDFERASPQGAWSLIRLGGGGALATEPSTRRAGRELNSVIPLFGDGGVSEARLLRSFDDANEVTLSYALRVDGPPAQSVQQIMAIVVNLAVGRDFFHAYLFVRREGITLVEQTFPGGGSAGSVFREHPLDVPIRFGSWQRVTLTETLSAPPHLRLTVDGKVAFDGAADPFFRRGTPSVSAGIHYSDAPSGPLSVRVDDLFVTVK